LRPRANTRAPATRRLESAIDSFEPYFFNHMILALDNYFLHKSRMMELKVGNPLNEVMVLCNSIMINKGKLCSDKTIKLDPRNRFSASRSATRSG
jgi:hypothetical protein